MQNARRSGSPTSFNQNEEGTLIIRVVDKGGCRLVVEVFATPLWRSRRIQSNATLSKGKSSFPKFSDQVDFDSDQLFSMTKIIVKVTIESSNVGPFYEEDAIAFYKSKQC